jgi:heterodisulfide reductase subunit D
LLEKLHKELYSCVRCGICRDWGGWKEADLICPWIKVTPGFEANYARGRMRLAQSFLEKSLPITNSFLEKVYLCSLCGSCEAHCPLELPTVNIFESLRSDLVEAGYQLERHKVLATRWLETGNPYGKTRTFNSHKQAKKADVLYFVGCTSAINASEIATATINVLERAGLSVTTLGEREPCCGSVFLRTGQRKLAKEAAAKTATALESIKPNLVVTACAGCYRTIKQDYPLLGVKYDFEVQHSTQFLGELIRKGKLKPKRFDETVTYHDPCHLGRHMKVYEEPREVLNSIPEIKYVEIVPRKEHSECCGAGGGARVAFQDKVNNIATNRLEQVKNTGAQILTSACPFCYVNFKDAINKTKSRLRMYDVSQIIDQATR